MATAKQRAARALFSKRAKSGFFKRKKKKSRSIKRTISKRFKRKRTRSKPLARTRKRSTRRRSVSGGFRRAKGGIGRVLKTGIPGKIVLGLGSAALVAQVTERLAPQFTGIATTAAAFLGGGIVGGAAQVLLSGGLGGLGGLFGGTASGGQSGEAV